MSENDKNKLIIYDKYIISFTIDKYFTPIEN